MGTMIHAISSQLYPACFQNTASQASYDDVIQLQGETYNAYKAQVDERREKKLLQQLLRSGISPQPKV